MSDIDNPEILAGKFHEAYERLAVLCGYNTRPESAVPWDRVPEKNRQLMIAVCSEIIASWQVEGERLTARAKAAEAENERLTEALKTCRELREYDRKEKEAAERERDELKMILANHRLRGCLLEKREGRYYDPSDNV